MVHRYQYGYNDAGDRTYARVAHADSGGSHDNDRSYLYTYDALHRLIKAELGVLTSSNDAIEQFVQPVPTTTTWALDNLGNWSRDAVDGSFVKTGDFDGDGLIDADPIAIHHSVDSANQIAEHVLDDGSTSTLQYRYDPNGNLVDDGSYTYHYDAWNRLIEVHAVTGGEQYHGLNQPAVSGDFGPPLLRFIYDGLGRLIVKEWDVGNYGFGDPDTTVDYYYDGVRRIQENHSTGLLDGGAPPDEDTLREYVWAPGYVDAALAQIDVDPVADEILYFIHDANYNVVAALDDAGDVVAQYVYTPYGELELVDDLTAHQPIAIGHQGLFFEPLDAATPDPTLTVDTPSIYHNRNRTYSPSLGRFLQRDPNETGQQTLTSMAYHGSAFFVDPDAFSLRGLYGDGLNLFLYLMSNPNSGTDPSGLDFQDDIDAAIAGIQADKAAALTSIRSSVGHVISVGKFLAEQAVGFLPGADAMLLISKLSRGEDLELTDVLVGVIGSAGGAAVLFKVVGKTIGALKKVRNARKIARNSNDRLVRTVCGNCFVVNTLVDTPDGSVPIESLQIGDEVLTRNQFDPTGSYQTGTVTRLYRRAAATILWLTFANGTVLGTTPGHEVWTENSGWGLAGNLCPGDIMIDGDGLARTLVQLQLDPTPTTVYNFEVAGTNTYFVHGIWVHNCSGPPRDAKGRFTSGAGGNTAEAVRGQTAHLNYRTALGGNYKYEVNLPSGRADAVDFENRIVRELKPDNPRAIEEDRRQLEKYRKDLEREYGGIWTAVVDTYRP